MAQTFDDQLRRALDEIADRLRHDLEAHFASASQQLADALDAERADAASVAASNAMVATEREVTDRLTAEFSARESALRAQEALVRETAYAEGLASGQAQARAELADQLAARETELASLRASFEARRAEADQAADAEAAGQALITDELRALRDAMQVIGRAGSLSEALDGLGNAVRSRADRVALFLVRDNALRQWMLAGFEGGRLQSAEYPLEVFDVIGEAVQRRAPRALTGEHLQDTAGRPSFASDTPGCTAAAAVPVAMHGKVVAVLYFELTTPGSDALRLALFCDLLAVHAACLLESLTVSRLVRLGAGGPLPSAPYGA